MKGTELTRYCQSNNHVAVFQAINTQTGIRPLVHHGNWLNPHLLHAANYLAGRYNLRTGCGYCRVQASKDGNSAPPPRVGIALLITGGAAEEADEFLTLTLRRIGRPREQFDLFVVNTRVEIAKAVGQRVRSLSFGWRSARLLNAEDAMKMRQLSRRTAKMAAM